MVPHAVWVLRAPLGGREPLLFPLLQTNGGQKLRAGRSLDDETFVLFDGEMSPYVI